MCCAHAGEKPAGAFQIVVYARRTGFFQFAVGCFVQQAVGNTDRNAGLRTHSADAGAFLLNLRRGQTFAGGDERKAQYTPFIIVLCLRNNRIGIQHWVFLCAGVIVRGLCTEFAVFRAFSTFCIDNCADIKPVPAKMTAQCICCRAQLCERQFGKFQCLRTADGTALPDIFCIFLYGHGSVPPVLCSVILTPALLYSKSLGM